MKELEMIEAKIQESEEKRKSLILEYEENYGVEYDSGDEVLDRIFWRDIDCIDSLIRNLGILKSVLVLMESGGKKNQHNANKGIEQVIHNARSVKHDMETEIQKAQEVIDEMDEIITVCEKYRK